MFSVVIADDNIQNREGLAAQVNWRHHGVERVLTAQNGAEGLALILAHRPFLALVDVEMPLMNGLEMVGKAQAQSAETHFVFISSFDKAEYIRSALRLGAIDYIYKPIDFVELEALIDRVVASHRARQQEIRQIQSYLGADEALPRAIFPLLQGLRKELSSRFGAERLMGDGQQTALVEHIIHEIDQSYMRSVSVGDLLSGLYVSENHANRIFKKATGQSIYSFLQRKRIYEAQRLLLGSRLKIHEIAERVGFNDASHFSAVFKSLTGYAPKEYVARFKSRE
ncbi:MAG: response regulator [Christensenellaceae bacterium]|jgi:YesN/AraC family two-component response regulator|nr:response regulator [Christensenellaceae bacterium]